MERKINSENRVKTSLSLDPELIMQVRVAMPFYGMRLNDAVEDAMRIWLREKGVNLPAPQGKVMGGIGVSGEAGGLTTGRAAQKRRV